MTIRSVHDTDRRRSGLASLELVIVLPLVILVLFAACEFALLFQGRQSLVTASRSGARVASLAGATYWDVEDAVRSELAGSFGDDLRVEAELGERSGDVVWVRLSAPMRAASPDLLKMIGLGLVGRDLFAETTMCKE
jgi:Flp pilus assembly protein TadG